jgi:hypothetical protein
MALAAAASLSLLALTAATAQQPLVRIDMYSDAQCPCSAQATSDMKALLDDPAFAAVDFNLWFVGGGITGTEPGKCIHGEDECVGQRFFSCAQNMSLAAVPGAVGLRGGEFSGPSYRQSPLWLEFQRCSYGPCDGSAAILGPSHPCKTYTTFTETTKNTIMRDCAAKLNISWTELAGCGLGARGQALMAGSGQVSKQRKVEYGLQGLPVVRINGVEVKTHKLIPIVCGPSPEEVRKAVCEAFPAASRPAKCGGGAGGAGGDSTR